MHARIYKPAKTAMSSGQARTNDWVLEVAGSGEKRIDPLMGWTSSSDMNQQVRLTFDTKEKAIAYAKRHNMAFEVEEPQVRVRKGKSYSANFAFTRKGQWTH